MKSIFLMIMLFLLTGCGESPLLNHEMQKLPISGHAALSESETLRFRRTDYSFTISWQDGPRMGGSVFLMKTWKKDLGTLNGPYQDLTKNLHVFLWMPSMGHGSAPVKLKKIGDGEYQVSEVQFIMGGNWEIKFQLKDANQVFDEAIVSLTI